MAKYRWSKIVRIEDKITEVRRQLNKYDWFDVEEELPCRYYVLMKRYYDLIYERRQFLGLEVSK